MGVDAPQVRADEAAGDDCRVVLGHAMHEEQRAYKGVGICGRDIDAVGGGFLRRVHLGLISAI